MSDLPSKAPRDAERGATALEFALVAPLLFFLLFAGMEAGRLMFVSAALHAAIADAARCAELGRTECQSAAGLAAHAEARTKALAAPMPIPPGALQLTPAACGLNIAVALPYRPLLLPVPGTGIGMSAAACANVPA
ncbi:MAG: TadE/TadG family type IV pilus assembly protein [Thermaurantiacus sp.]